MRSIIRCLWKSVEAHLPSQPTFLCHCYRLFLFLHNSDFLDTQAPGEKKKKLFGKKLSFTKGKDRTGSEDTLSADDCKLAILLCLGISCTLVFKTMSYSKSLMASEWHYAKIALVLHKAASIQVGAAELLNRSTFRKTLLSVTKILIM